MAYGIAVEFLDTGMGDSTLVQLPPWDRGPLWLVDFGEKGSPSKIPATDATLFLVSRIHEVCKNRGLQLPKVDFLCISHADGDHWNKLDWIIEGKTEDKKNLWEGLGYPTGTKLSIDNLVFGGDWANDFEKRDLTLANLIKSRVTTKVWDLASGDHDVPDQFGNVTPRWSYNLQDPDLATRIYLLSSNLPKKGEHDCNPKSLVLMFQYKQWKLILTGDAEAKTVEPAIIDYYKNSGTFLQAQALKLGHHGSAYSSSEAWLKAVKPAAIFASGDRRWGHPYCDPIARAIQVGSLGQTTNHWFTCSSSGSENDYESKTATLQICTNIWYVVTNKLGITLKGYDGNDHTGAYGLYTGVQWRLQLDSDATYLTHTDQWPLP
jgi:competence protein ComEC